ncbi:ribosome small subunit-dependent GTPase A [Bacillus sp. BHET2]|uniref:ribosome small subunit-dependent GTPase A n=1 Tax=Bacillus sp. BHET2 TaxID=2583818 RepID=UPI00110E3DE7|nr:ribosome small subunit-dependent GTPase A [Bacillus sp. BHET2]TMU87831.1 ribosome small subunit-dependent GTPase A [Bacillus sp. BHET2]
MPEGKIVKALSGFYYVLSEGSVTQCRGRGIFRKNKVTPLVGDYVEFQAENQTEGYLLKVFDRKNELVRPPIANVDQSILVFSASEPDFSPALLDRFLVLVESKEIEPLICVTKMDLLTPDQSNKIEGFVEDYRSFGYEVLMTSSKTEHGVEELTPYLKDKISVFAGQSGVGKSSLLNALKPELELKTAMISSHLGRGKHTTRHVELIDIENGLVADTPGFSSLEFSELEIEELPQCFPEMVEVAEKCKFRGCLHINEPKCAVKSAVEDGEIPAYRYEHYLTFHKEIKERKPRY